MILVFLIQQNGEIGSWMVGYMIDMGGWRGVGVLKIELVSITGGDKILFRNKCYFLTLMLNSILLTYGS